MYEGLERSLWERWQRECPELVKRLEQLVNEDRIEGYILSSLIFRSLPDGVTTVQLKVVIGWRKEVRRQVLKNQPETEEAKVKRLIVAAGWNKKPTPDLFARYVQVQERVKDVLGKRVWLMKQEQSKEAKGRNWRHYCRLKRLEREWQAGLEVRVLRDWKDAETFRLQESLRLDKEMAG